MKTSLLIAMMALTAAGLSAEEYKIDGSHSKAQFSVKHLMVSNVRGEFGKMSGTVVFDEKNPGTTKIDATLDATTINTGVAQRDEHLRGADFFDTAKFPTLTFKSKSARKTADGLAVTGDLTMHGVTKEVVLNVEGPSAEVKDPWGNQRRGATATAKIKRSDFGLNWNKAVEAGGVMVGDDIAITIDVEATRAGAKK
ncbi:MAG: YceI family protein [Bryobacterales bacterium]|nr:YceI family protein [Bryobacterales bacterium]